MTRSILLAKSKTAIVFTSMYFLLSGAYASGQNNKVVARLIRYEVQPEFQAAFRQAVSDYVFHSLKSKTNVLSEAYYEQADTTVLWVIERWSNKGELDKASRSSGFQAIDSLSPRMVLPASGKSARSMARYAAA